MIYLRYMSNERPSYVIVVMLNEKEHVVLSRTNEQYGFPTIAVEWDETPMEAALRWCNEARQGAQVTMHQLSLLDFEGYDQAEYSTVLIRLTNTQWANASDCQHRIHCMSPEYLSTFQSRYPESFESQVASLYHLGIHVMRKIQAAKRVT